MGTITIKGVPFAFEEVELTYDNAVIIDPSVAKMNLIDFKNVLEAHHVHFLIMHGTLLGALREHAFIKHDIDIDTCTLDEEGLINVIPELDKMGLKLCRYESHVIYSFIRDGVYIDVYVVNKLKGLIRPFYVRYLNRIIPRKYTPFWALRFLSPIIAFNCWSSGMVKIGVRLKAMLLPMTRIQGART